MAGHCRTQSRLVAAYSTVSANDFFNSFIILAGGQPMCYKLPFDVHAFLVRDSTHTFSKYLRLVVYCLSWAGNAFE